MSDNDNPNPSEQPKENLSKFILRLNKSFEIKTAGLGTIVSFRMTVDGFRTFISRLKNFQDVDDLTLVRIYLGCVSCFPPIENDAIPKQLTVEQVEALTNEDVLEWAREYLVQVIKPEVVANPIAQVAEYIKIEKAAHEDSIHEMGAALKSAFNIDATSEVMRHWKQLSESLNGPMVSLKDDLAKFLKPLEGYRSPLEDALKDMEMERGVFKSMPHVQIDIPSINKFPDMPPFSETPLGKTADAVQELRGVGVKLVEAGSLILTQASNISDRVSEMTLQGEKALKVIEKAAESSSALTIQGEKALKVLGEAGERSEKNAKSALNFSKWSLGISALAFIVSAVFGGLGYLADREEAKSGDRASNFIIQELKTQNELLRQINKQKQPTIKTKPQVPAPPGK